MFLTWIHGYCQNVKGKKTTQNLGKRQVGSFRYVGDGLFLKLDGGHLNIHCKKCCSLKVLLMYYLVYALL